MAENELPFGGFRGIEAACNNAGYILLGLVGIDAFIFNDNSAAKNTIGLLAGIAFFGAGKQLSKHS